MTLKNISKFKLKHKKLMMHFPIDDVVRVTLVMTVLMEKWAHRDSMEKTENQAEKEIEV